jgi:hypothetical protein
MMTETLLQQLKDIHLPAAPALWPPAPGWWLLGAGALACCGLALRWAYRSYQRRRPIIRARSVYKAIHQNLVSGEISAETYLHQSNELLKRLLIHGLGMRAARPASGDAWLQILDERYGQNAFSDGPGQILGNERFHHSPTFHAEPLHALLCKFLREVKP